MGAGTQIWAFTHVLDGAVIGRDCNICDHVFIEDQVVVGDRVTVKSGVQLWNGMIVEDDVFIGPNATFSNDSFPRSKQHQTSLPVTTICRNASIGAGATILPGLTVGHNAMIGAGSVVTSNVQPNAIVSGNPARVVGYVDAKREVADIPYGRQFGRYLSQRRGNDSERRNLTQAEAGRGYPGEPRGRGARARVALCSGSLFYDFRCSWTPRSRRARPPHL